MNKEPEEEEKEKEEKKEEKDIDIFVAPYKATRWLTFSSLLFIIPSIYSYFIQSYYFSYVLVFCSLISANYWRRATYGWRRNADLLYSKFAFVTFVSNGIYYVRPVNVHIGICVGAYVGLFFLCYCFYLSGKLYNIQYVPKEKNANGYWKWFHYHALFHFIMMFEQCIIIYSMNKAIINKIR